MTQEELKKLYGAFFRAEGLVTKRCFMGPYYAIVMYEGYGYNVILDTKRNHGGTCFQMFTWWPVCNLRGFPRLLGECPRIRGQSARCGKQGERAAYHWQG
jgi:hypothetical protein